MLFRSQQSRFNVLHRVLQGSPTICRCSASMSSEMLQAVYWRDSMCCRVCCCLSYTGPSQNYQGVANKQSIVNLGNDRSNPLRFHEHKTSLSGRVGKFPITTSSAITGSLKHDVEESSRRPLICRRRAGGTWL